MSDNITDSRLDGDRTMSPDVMWEDNLSGFLRSFRKANLSRNSISFSEFNDRWEYEDWVTCLLGEIGEAIDVRKKIKRVESLRMEEYTLGTYIEHKREFGREIADAWTYLDIALAKKGHPSPGFDAARMEKAKQTVEKAGIFRAWVFVAGLACSMVKYSISYDPAMVPDLASDIFHLLLAICEGEGLDFKSILTEKFNLVSDRVGSEIKL